MSFVDLAEKKFSAAESRLGELYKNSKDVRALTGLTEVYLAQNQTKEALQLGQAHQFNGDLPRAILAFRRAIQISPRSLEAVLRLAYAYEVSSQPREAIAAYRQALAINANTPIAMNNLAYLLSENGGDRDEALKLAQLALQRVPQQKYIFYVFNEHGFDGAIRTVPSQGSLLDDAEGQVLGAPRQIPGSSAPPPFFTGYISQSSPDVY